MNALTGPGLVLRRVRHLEDDVRMTVLLRHHGKIMITSRGGQRLASRMRAVQEPFSEAELQIYAPEHGNNGRLAGGKLLDSHPRLRSRMDAFQTASRAAETVDMLLPYRAPSPDVYDILRHTFRTLQDAESPAVEWVMFVVRLLKTLGHGDISDKAAALLAEAESEPESRERCLAFADGELERVLPWKLKSEIQNQ